MNDERTKWKKSWTRPHLLSPFVPELKNCIIDGKSSAGCLISDLVNHTFILREHIQSFTNLYINFKFWFEKRRMKKKILEIYLKEICQVLVINTIIFTTNSNLLFPIQLKPDGVTLLYLKLRIFYLTEFIGWKS